MIPVGVSSTDDEGDSDSSEDEDEDQSLCPKYSATAELPSVGSALHGIGSCKRCCFFPKGRCANGLDCGFCHFEHDKWKSKGKNKKKKKQRRGGRRRGEASLQKAA